MTGAPAGPSKGHHGAAHTRISDTWPPAVVYAASCLPQGTHPGVPRTALLQRQEAHGPSPAPECGWAKHDCSPDPVVPLCTCLVIITVQPAKCFGGVGVPPTTPPFVCVLVTHLLPACAPGVAGGSRWRPVARAGLQAPPARLAHHARLSPLCGHKRRRLCLWREQCGETDRRAACDPRGPGSRLPAPTSPLLWCKMETIVLSLWLVCEALSEVTSTM